MAAKWWRSGAGTAMRALSSSSSPLSKTSSHHTIQAIPREVTGSKISAKERKLGRIPAVIMNQNSIGVHKDLRDSDFRKSLVTTEKNEILKIMKSVEIPFFCSTRFEIQIRPGSGSKVLLDSGKVLPIKVYRDEKTEEIINLEFVWANEGTELKVDVPVVFKGEDVCPGLVKGGELKRIRTSLRLVGPAELIPPMIEVDVSNLDLGDRVLFADLGVDSSLKLLKENDQRPICKVVSTKLETSPESA